MFEIITNGPFHPDFRYEDISKYPYDEYEFGVSWYRGILVHKMPDGIYVASYNGQRIIEWHPNGDVVLIFKDNHTPSVSNRMSIGQLVIYSVYKKTNAKGDTHKKIKLAINNQNCTIDVQERLVIRQKNNVIVQLIPDEIKVSTKNNAKYKEFNKRLKPLKAALVAQCKFGVYKKIDYKAEASALFESTYLTYTQRRELFYKTALEYMDTQDPLLLKTLAILAFLNSYKLSYRRDDTYFQANAVLNELRKFQTSYLKRECLI